MFNKSCIIHYLGEGDKKGLCILKKLLGNSYEALFPLSHLHRDIMHIIYKKFINIHNLKSRPRTKY